jgi:chemotaxis signal transduction protein
VDEVAQVLRIDSSEISEAPSLVSSIAKEFIKGVAKFEEQLVIILMIDKILSNSDVVELEKMGE